MKTNQKEAVFHAITSVLTESDIDFSEGLDVATVMTRELRAQVNEILFNGFKNGSIELDKEFNDSDLKGYVSGLQSNWIRKDKRLNGGVQYLPKNPGSRAGQGDSQLKALRALLKTQVDADKISEIQSYIDKRVSEIGSAKADISTVNMEDLPADLQAKYGFTS